ncbi:effector-associated constant component EACC1 [Actinoplanes friuliensis]|uniref:effector-associated constant component EACC1 n=1 Tax=Actinoplanes friuliensis TaxID=196914 RepID=UPI0011DE41CF|nr:hypothetical protein [Actinoplanes friuliensis]
MNEFRFAIDGVGDPGSSLLNWLRQEELIKGCVSRHIPPIQPGELGAFSELAVAIPTIAGAAAVVARSIALWMAQNRSDVTLTVKAEDGTDLVTLEAKRVRDPQRLIQAVLETARPIEGSPDEAIEE